MKWFGRLVRLVCRDNRSGREQVREREFIDTLNGLKTLRVTPDGGMSIDPEEIRDRVIASRHALKHFVRRP
ncbi:hypothetical protein D3C75_833900 [compost metagenome]|uniref:Uncharacterized protein n=1 Tax=Pseudomonas fluorescens TaxID=294 RepID=A0A5E7RA85_PSEFL|nr:hypothetical protein PS922_00797 [Pseudomonas fluorescens]